MKRKLLLILVLLIAFAALASCAVDNGDEKEEPDEAYRVMVSVVEGLTVTSQNPVDVKKGGSVSFDVALGSGYVFSSVNYGTYDEASGRLTVDNVTERMTVKFELEYLDYDLNAEYPYSFIATEKDTTSVESTDKLKAGTKITVTAGDNMRIFKGWSYGALIDDGGELLSEEKTYTFRLSPAVIKNGALTLYANYADSNVYYYDPNGGYVDTTSRNMAENDYYTANVDGECIKITLLQRYCDFAESACTFWDDGTFYRYGYVLKEYNTAADGTGEGYSLGSKFYPVVDGEVPTLYCIWERCEKNADFDYKSAYMQKPEKAVFAPDWKSTGIAITSYLGDDETVTVPEEIDGRKVIAICAGTFTNKSMTTLILPKTLQKVEDGAFVGCSSLETLYYPNSIYEISDAAFDEATYDGFKNLYVNATMAPRYTNTGDGGFAVKLSRFLAATDEKKIIVISGSSTYQGLATEYMEALFEGEYTVINFGTTRPRPGLFYLEALSHYTDEDDIFVYAPENSAFMMGEGLLNWRMIRDLEGMNNLFRYVDISNYYGYFSAFSELNREYNYTVKERKYEEMVDNIQLSDGKWRGTDKNGDYQHPLRQDYLNPEKYIDAYFITFNERFKSIKDIDWNKVDEQIANSDYTDPNNETWTSIDRPELVARMNMAIGKAKSGGAKVYFGFCPVDSAEVVPASQNMTQLLAYDKMIEDLYDFDGNLGSAADYVYNSKYFYDCAFHVNDYGRAYRTYMLYADIAELLGIDINGFYSVGTDFDGCLFEQGSDGTPITKVDYLN